MQERKRFLKMAGSRFWSQKKNVEALVRLMKYLLRRADGEQMSLRTAATGFFLDATLDELAAIEEYLMHIRAYSEEKGARHAPLERFSHGAQGSIARSLPGYAFICHRGCRYEIEALTAYKALLVRAERMTSGLWAREKRVRQIRQLLRKIAWKGDRRSIELYSAGLKQVSGLSGLVSLLFASSI